MTLKVEPVAGIGEARFRLASDTGAPMVQAVILYEAESLQVLWPMAPEGVEAVETTSLFEPSYEPQSLDAAGLTESDSAGPVAVELAALTIGVASSGFHQVIPHSGPAPALVLGRRYRVVVVTSTDMAMEEFTA